MRWMSPSISSLREANHRGLKKNQHLQQQLIEVTRERDAAIDCSKRMAGIVHKVASRVSEEWDEKHEQIESLHDILGVTVGDLTYENKKLLVKYQKLEEGEETYNSRLQQFQLNNNTMKAELEG